MCVSCILGCNDTTSAPSRCPVMGLLLFPASRCSSQVLQYDRGEGQGQGGPVKLISVPGGGGEATRVR